MIKQKQSARSKLLLSERYNIYRIRKKHGGSRLISEPDSELKELQEGVRVFLEESFPYPICVHGFIKGRSIKTNALPHQGAKLILNLDVKDFFPSCRIDQVKTTLKYLGYKIDSLDEVLGYMFLNNGLPQGSPASPSLANICFYNIDLALMELSCNHDLYYTRYADDLTFSFTETWLSDNVVSTITSIVNSGGFRINNQKTSFQHAGARQLVTGLEVSRGVGIGRKKYSELRKGIIALKKEGRDLTPEELGFLSYTKGVDPNRYDKLMKVLNK